jgi:(S)-2-hydroxy-acid oxidase
MQALALGAQAVFLGRPVLWGLVHKGEEGVSAVLKLLNDEFVMAMQLSGCVKISDIKPSLVRPALQFQSKL